MHILSPETDNCPSWISGRERMTVENTSWSISMKECCRPWRGLNPWPPGLQLDSASNWALKYWDTLSHFHTCLKIWTNPFSLLEVSKNLWLELQTGEPLPCWTWIFSAFANNVDPDHLASEEAKWSGSALFAIQYVNMYQQPGLSKPIGWKIEVGVAS